MLAEGALAAGCRFFAGYPITPASEIYEVMMRELPAHGGLALSAPDEISSLCYCVGASLRGLKVMTATSGPGWALMIETAQYALMTETPVVVALVQRLGPSTGGATQGAQGDSGAETGTSCPAWVSRATIQTAGPSILKLRGESWRRGARAGAAGRGTTFLPRGSITARRQIRQATQARSFRRPMGSARIAR